MPFYAHSLSDHPQSDWETMAEHEERVAARCGKFLSQVHPELAAWGDILGRWHDLGKYSSEFQGYISQSADSGDAHQAETRGRVDHSTAGAQWMAERCKRFGKLFAYALAGHHAGLPDWDDGESHSGLRHRLHKSVCDWKTNAPDALAQTETPPFPCLSQWGTRPLTTPEEASFRVQFLCRMMFSALVDADFLATEQFMSETRADQRPKNTPPMSALRQATGDYLDELARGKTSRVNKIRSEVRQLCQQAATKTPGFFSLNVPTGGGKTLGSLEFALLHAERHGLNRIIVAVPFTSIIEQNVDVYRSVFQEISDDVVVEHHSNLEPNNETVTNRLQAENWDASVIVTTNVQLFESLFATRTSRCRKLHRIAGSVIVLDEAQTLPVDLLQPTLMALKELVNAYNCTVVLCTATQPALTWREEFKIGLEQVRPIIPDADALHTRLRRTSISVRGVLGTSDLAEEVAELEQVLCIVNTRAEAAELFEAIGEMGGNFHLSTRMCGAHRSQKIAEIRLRLETGKTCRVVSTQLIEAGVDVDFPTVYRAICGLDSLAQAAGRCNREGRRESGDVYLFETESPPPAGFLRQTAETTRELLPDFSDLISPAATHRYFDQLYWRNSDVWDRHQVLQAFGRDPSSLQFNFRQADQRFRFIRDATQPVLVPWVGEKANGLGQKLCRQLESGYGLNRSFWRQAQRYSISLREHECLNLSNTGAIGRVNEHWVLLHKHLYDEQRGLCLSLANGVIPADDLII